MLCEDNDDDDDDDDDDDEHLVESNLIYSISLLSCVPSNQAKITALQSLCPISSQLSTSPGSS